MDDDHCTNDDFPDVGGYTWAKAIVCHPPKENIIWHGGACPNAFLFLQNRLRHSKTYRYRFDGPFLDYFWLSDRFAPACVNNKAMPKTETKCKIMRGNIISLILLLSILLTGCREAEEIEKLGLINARGVDTGEDNLLETTLVVFQFSAQSEDNTKIIPGRGKTIKGAMEDAEHA